MSGSDTEPQAIVSPQPGGKPVGNDCHPALHALDMSWEHRGHPMWQGDVVLDGVHALLCVLGCSDPGNLFQALEAKGRSQAEIIFPACAAERSKEKFKPE